MSAIGLPPNPAPISPPASTPARAPSQRLLFIDNIRWTMIVLVISMHAADTYSPLGNWYYVDRPPIGPATLLTFAAWQTYLQSFFMGLLSFASGLFIPSSLARRGPRRFIRDRAFRLGLPVLFYMFILGPVTEYYLAHSWTAPYSFAHEWWHHIVDGEFLSENGPLWFCLALLIFSSAYAIGWRSQDRHPSGPAPPPDSRILIAFALAMALGRFLIRGIFPNLVVLNMHVGDFAQYVLLFGAGIAAARGQWVTQLPVTRARRWTAIVLPLSAVCWLAVLASGRAADGTIMVHDNGWYWQSAALSLWESFTCVAICLGLLVLYRTRFNRQGRLAHFLSDNAFSVYVFHPPFVILGARLLHLVQAPALGKFATLTVFATIVTFALSATVFRRLPLLRAIL